MSTSIGELPIDSAMSENIKMTVQHDLQNHINQKQHQMPQQMQQQMPQQMAQMPQQTTALDQSTISQIVSGLQQASITGVTSLPTRDIPMSQQHITHDPQATVNYIPTHNNHNKNHNNNTDYLDAEYNNNNNTNNKNHNHNTYSTFDSIYDCIQLPLLVATLYFLFQLPIFKQTLFKYCGDWLFHKDGNYNLAGLLTTCIMFGLTVYSVHYLATYL